MTLTESSKANIHIPNRDQFHKEYAGEIFKEDFETEGVIHQRSSGRRQFTQTEIIYRCEYYARNRK